MLPGPLGSVVEAVTVIEVVVFGVSVMALPLFNFTFVTEGDPPAAAGVYVITMMP